MIEKLVELPFGHWQKFLRIAELSVKQFWTAKPKSSTVIEDLAYQLWFCYHLDTKLNTNQFLNSCLSAYQTFGHDGGIDAGTADLKVSYVQKYGCYTAQSAIDRGFCLQVSLPLQEQTQFYVGSVVVDHDLWIVGYLTKDEMRSGCVKQGKNGSYVEVQYLKCRPINELYEQFRSIVA